MDEENGYWVVDFDRGGKHCQVVSFSRSREKAIDFCHGCVGSEVIDQEIVKQIPGGILAVEPNRAIPRVKKKLLRPETSIVAVCDRMPFLFNVDFPDCRKLSDVCLVDLGKMESGANNIHYDSTRPILFIEPRLFMLTEQAKQISRKKDANKARIRSRALGIDVCLPAIRPYPNRHIMTAGPMLRFREDMEHLTWPFPCSAFGQFDLQVRWETEVGTYIHDMTGRLERTGRGNVWSMERLGYPMVTDPYLITYLKGEKEEDRSVVIRGGVGALTMEETMNIPRATLSAHFTSWDIRTLWRVDPRQKMPLVAPSADGAWTSPN